MANAASSSTASSNGHLRGLALPGHLARGHSGITHPGQCAHLFALGRGRRKLRGRALVGITTGTLRAPATLKSVPQESPTRMSDKSVLQECPARVSYKSSPQECPTRLFRKVSHKSVRQECSARVLRKSATVSVIQEHKSDKQECPKVSHKSGKRECPARVSRKSVPREGPTRVSCNSAPQEFPTRVSQQRVLQECSARVSYKVFHKSAQECPTKVSEKNVSYKSLPQKCQKLLGRLFSSTCWRSGSCSWVPPFFTCALEGVREGAIRTRVNLGSKFYK